MPFKLIPADIIYKLLNTFPEIVDFLGNLGIKVNLILDDKLFN
jgi:hypothetical protein